MQGLGFLMGMRYNKGKNAAVGGVAAMGIRIVKTAIATVIALYIASALSLDLPLSAGLLAILGIEVTRKRGLLNASARFFASLVALLVASLAFLLFGFHLWVLGLFVLAAFPVLSRVGLSEGIVTGAVVVFHVFGLGRVDLSILWNEVALLLVGLGTATVVNMVYMPREDRQLEAARRQVEAYFSEIFRQVAAFLNDPATEWDGKELILVQDEVERGIATAVRWKENLRDDQPFDYLGYFRMRRRHIDSIHRMMGYAAQLSMTVEHGRLAAQLFEELSRDVQELYYTGRVEAQLEKLEAAYDSMPLPESHREFEARSAVLQLCLELKHYVSIAKKEKKRKSAPSAP